MRRKTPAHESFTKLGLKPTDWTDAMKLAHKQKWTNLPTDLPVGELRDQLAAVTQEPTPTVTELMADGFLATGGNAPLDREAATKEAARLKRNAAVNAWRQRGMLRAALEARETKFAKMRAGKATKAAA